MPCGLASSAACLKVQARRAQHISPLRGAGAPGLHDLPDKGESGHPGRHIGSLDRAPRPSTPAAVDIRAIPSMSFLSNTFNSSYRVGWFVCTVIAMSLPQPTMCSMVARCLWSAPTVMTLSLMSKWPRSSLSIEISFILKATSTCPITMPLAWTIVAKSCRGDGTSWGIMSESVTSKPSGASTLSLLVDTLLSPGHTTTEFGDLDG